MISNAYRNLTFDTIDEVARSTSLSQVSETFAVALNKLGYTALGINGLPRPENGADPVILTEYAPDGFRDIYIHERFYLVDHICRHARAALEPFRYSDAPYNQAQAHGHRRFLEALHSFGMAKGAVVPIGRSASMPACVWLAGEDPELSDDAMQAVQLIGLFAASKACALSLVLTDHPPVLTAREREVLTWAAQGKSSWEIGQILNIAKRTVDEYSQRAARKLGASNKTQAVVLALLKQLIEF
jgi:LuxR family transcriptional regulator, quorum-sensing system regulator BjaR1